MKERGIPMNGPNVINILEGRKTHTRRIIKNQPCPAALLSRDACANSGYSFIHDLYDDQLLTCPQGKPGDRLWVREAWRTGEKLDAHSGSKIAELADAAGYKGPRPKCSLKYEADDCYRAWCSNDIEEFGEWGRYRHARFMPRWAARTVLDIVDIRVERLNEISADDAKAEGISPCIETVSGHPLTYKDYTNCKTPRMDCFLDPIQSFCTLWESINGKGSWKENPWVWVIEFKMLSHAT